MVNNKTLSSLIIFCFLLLTVQNSIALIGLATARKLADDPQSKDTSGNNDGEQHKIGVGGSTSGHAGSATGDGSPSSTVQTTPPARAAKIVVANVPPVSSQGTPTYVVPNDPPPSPSEGTPKTVLPNDPPPSPSEGTPKTVLPNDPPPSPSEGTPKTVVPNVPPKGSP